MPLADYDFFALRSYSFAMRKTNSFFSLGTILLSLLIITLSLVLNINTISHLWLPKSEINVNSNKLVSIPGTITSTLVCVQPTNYTKTQPFPAIKLRNSNYIQISYRLVSEAEVGAANARLRTFIGTNFVCLDLGGITFNSSGEKLHIQVAWKLAKVYITGSSLENVLYDKWIPPIVTDAFQGGKYSKYCYYIQISFLEATIRDKLYINYQPEHILTFQTSNKYALTELFTFPDNLILPNNTSFYVIEAYQPAQLSTDPTLNTNLELISIERYDIGYIIGSFLSWLSIFTLIFSYVVGPIMDASLNLVLIQTIFHLHPSTRKPSIIKFLIASLKSGIFEKEDKFIAINDKLQKLKDVGFIMKLQLLLAAITPKQSEEKDAIIVSEHSFGEAKEEIGIETYEEPLNSRIDIFEGSEEEKVSLVVKLRQKLFKFLDSGSDSISINFQGSGYGSVLSLSITILFAVGLISFFVIFGVLKSSTSIQDVNLINYDDLTYSIKKQEIFLATQYSDTPIDFYLMDGNYKIKGTAPIQPYSDCRSRMPSRMKNDTDGWVIYCFGDDVELSQSTNKQNEIFLFADIRDYSSDKKLWFYFDTTIIKNEKPLQIGKKIDLEIADYYMPEYNTCRELGVKVINYQSDTASDSYSDYLVPTDQKYTRTTFKMRGFYYRLTGQRQVTLSTTTFFDIVQNLWSLATICITLVLMKLTKYINLRKKEQVLSSQRSDYRDNICILLSKLNGLLQGKNRKQIQSLKYYIKTPLEKAS